MAIQTIKYLFFSRLLFLLFAVLAQWFVPLQKGYLGSQFAPNAPYLAWIWANFDGRHFLNIATHGYSNFDFAYFPLYPLTILLAGKILPIEPLYLAIGIALLSLFIATIVFRKLVLFDYSRKIANLSIILLLFFPLSFFYNSVYTDSLFLLLSVLCLYFARRGKWFTAGLFGYLCTLSRLSGIALAPALAVEWFLQNRKKIEIQKLDKLFWNFAKTVFGAISLVGLGVVSYMLYLKFNFGDMFLFQKSMVAWKQSEFVFPPQVVFRYIKIFLSVDMSLLVYWIALLEFFSMILYMLLAIYTLRFVRASYGVFMIVLLLLVSFTGTFAGTPRYMLHLFPGFIAMAQIVEKKKVLLFGLLALFLLLGFILTSFFTRGYFVA